MISDFNFLGFSPDQNLERKANLAVERLLDLAPRGSMAVALLEQENASFRCAIEIYSKQGPFIARGCADTAESALEAVVRSLSKKLDRWRGRREVHRVLKTQQRVPA